MSATVLAADPKSVTDGNGSGQERDVTIVGPGSPVVDFQLQPD